MQNAPVIVWIRRDLRWHDNPALVAAAATGKPVLPVFLADEAYQALGRAARLRYALGIRAFAESLSRKGHGLLIRKGRAGDVLQALAAETGARQIHMNQAVDPAVAAKDREIESQLLAAGIEVVAYSCPGLLHDPRALRTGAGQGFRVFTPFWRALASSEIGSPVAPPVQIKPATLPDGLRVDDLVAEASTWHGAADLADRQLAGESAALDRLEQFLDAGQAGYADARDRIAEPGTSGLSAALAWGEITPRQIWAASRYRGGGDAFRRQLAWRDFAYHLLHHFPDLAQANWRRDWDSFGWSRDPANPVLRAWQRGRTGVPLVDAGLREMYVTGHMHNRVRMVVASYLTKHLLVHWQSGLRWFADHLTDWDPASNALGWQWVAGSGPDASPFFRVFNPETQAKKFDPDGGYRDRWLAEGRLIPTPEATAYFQMTPRQWQIAPGDLYPGPVVGLAEGRARALHAYDSWREGRLSDN